MADTAVAPRGFAVDKNDGRAVLPGSLHTNRRLSQWVRFDPAGTVSIFTGKVELGQGLLTALAMIAAEELDVPVERIRMVSASTVAGPDEGMTSGSQSIQDSGKAIRYACAEIRAIALAKFPEFSDLDVNLDVDAGNFVTSTGDIVGSYWTALVNGELDVEATAAFAPKAFEKHRLVGKSLVPRIDLPDKVFGNARFVQDLSFGGMLHGRIVRPPSLSAQLIEPLDHDLIAEALNGAKLVVDGRFVGVVAPKEQLAVMSAAAVKERLQWSENPDLPKQAGLRDFLLQAPHETSEVFERGCISPVASGSRSYESEYLKPYLAHASIGPSCALARWNGIDLEVWTHSQGIQNLRDDIRVALAQGDKPAARQNIQIHHVEGSGCYGHNGADDAAFDAVLLAMRFKDRHVRVLWSRADELTCSPFAPAHLVRLSATLDEQGTLVQWNHELWANGYSSRPGRSTTPTLLAAGHRTSGTPPPLAINAPLSAGGGADRNSIPAYQVPNTKILNNRLMVMPVRTSAMRALGGYANVFAIESFMDEIANSIDMDGIDFRKRHLQDERALAVIDSVIRNSTWWLPPKEKRAAGVDVDSSIGQGFAWARYKNTGAWCAVIVRIQAGEEIRVLDIDIAVDVGQVIDADGVINQIEGGALQSVSWTLKEQVTFDETRITSNEWTRYPILRFSEVPNVKVTLASRQDQDSLGAGEAAQGPVAAAIGNAVFDALGVRVRTLPLNQVNIMAAMDE